jgi:hypothetical protein
VDEPDYYEILEVSTNATRHEIKTAYRKLAKIYHPDAQGTEEAKVEAAPIFRRIQLAYETLHDLAERAEYDNRHGFNQHDTRTKPRARSSDIARLGAVKLEPNRADFGSVTVGGIDRKLVIEVASPGVGYGELILDGYNENLWDIYTTEEASKLHLTIETVGLESRAVGSYEDELELYWQELPGHPATLPITLQVRPVDATVPPPFRTPTTAESVDDGAFDGVSLTKYVILAALCVGIPIALWRVVNSDAIQHPSGAMGLLAALMAVTSLASFIAGPIGLIAILVRVWKKSDRD